MTFDDLFAITHIEENRWIAPGAPRTDEPRLFGGLLLGQAIVAASRGARSCYALHALFIGAARRQAPFDISVEVTRDGRTFSTRRIEIRERQRLLFSAYCSHHDGEDGPEHQVEMPDVSSPETLEDRRLARARRAGGSGLAPKRYIADEMLDVRPIEPPSRARGTEARRAIWFRSRERILGSPEIHQAAIAFASDMGLVHVGLQLHHDAFGEGSRIEAASLDHSIWFHRDVTADDWMLMVQRSPTAAHGRGFSDAQIFARDGRLVATVAQAFFVRRERD